MQVETVILYVTAALLLVLLWMSVSRLLRANRLVFVALACLAAFEFCWYALVIYSASAGIAFPSGADALPILAVSVLLVGVVCEASGGYSKIAAPAAAALLLVSFAIFIIGMFGFLDAEPFGIITSGAALVLAAAALLVALLVGVMFPHYIVQGLVFLCVSGVLALFSRVSGEAPAWMPLAVISAQAFAFFSFILYSGAAQAPVQQDEDEGEDPETQVRTAVMKVCTEVSHGMEALAASGAGDKYLERGLEVVSGAMREVMGYQHVSLAVSDPAAAEVNAINGKMRFNGRVHGPGVTLSGDVMRKLLDSNEPLVSADARTDRRLDGCSFPSLTWHSVALIPLRSGAGRHLVLIVGDRADGLPFDEFDTFAFVLLKEHFAMSFSYMLTRDELYAAANLDPVTLLRNYSAFQKILEQTMRSTDMNGGNFALTLFDIDQFYRVNETLGFEHGDEILRGIGDTIKTYAETGIVGRVGPDEFAILLRGEPAGIRENIDAILKHLNQVAAQLCPQIRLTLSAAFAIYPFDFLEQTNVFGKMREALGTGSSTGKMMRVKCN